MEFKATRTKQNKEIKNPSNIQPEKTMALWEMRSGSLDIE